MARRICLQAGHANCQYNSIVALRKSTGASNEMSFNVDIRNKVAAELRARGFEVVTTDANANDDKNITKTDFDLFLAIHYDADVYRVGGGFVDTPDPSVDSANSESLRIAKHLADEYFSNTKIVNHPERSNLKTKFYYMWKFLTSKTPCVIIECGVGMHVPDDHQVLHFMRPVVVMGIVAGICAAFDVPYQQTTPIDPCAETRAGLAKFQEAYQNTKIELEKKDKKLAKISESLTTLQTMLSDLITLTISK